MFNLSLFDKLPGCLHVHYTESPRVIKKINVHGASEPDKLKQWTDLLLNAKAGEFGRTRWITGMIQDVAVTVFLDDLP